MDAPPDQAGSERIGAEAPALSASPRLQLEVALLAASEPPPLAPPAAAVEESDAEARSVLVLVSEPDLGAYIGECLRSCPDLRVTEPLAGESARDALRRLRPALLIAEVAALAGEGSGQAGRSPALPEEPGLPPVPLLLIAEEGPEDGAVKQAWRGAPLAYLLQPFNARGLPQAVERLLGRDGAVQRPGQE